MYFLLTEKGQKIIKSNEKAIARANISLSDVGNFKVPLTSKFEQIEIIKSVDSIERKIQVLSKKKETLFELFKTLLQELMTGERRVHEKEFEALNKECKI